MIIFTICCCTNDVFYAVVVVGQTPRGKGGVGLRSGCLRACVQGVDEIQIQPDLAAETGKDVGGEQVQELYSIANGGDLLLQGVQTGGFEGGKLSVGHNPTNVLFFARPFGRNIGQADLCQQCFAAVLQGNIQCVGGDDCHVSAQETGCCRGILSFCQTDCVGKSPGTFPDEIGFGRITQHPQNKGDVFCGGNFPLSVEGGGAGAVDQTGMVCVSHAVCCPGRNISEGQFHPGGVGFLFFSKQAEQHDNGLLAGKDSIQIKVGGAVGICTGTLHESKVVQPVCCRFCDRAAACGERGGEHA